MRAPIRVAALGSAALLLAACSTLQGAAPAGAEDETAWQQHQVELSKLTDWSFSGRVGFVNGKDSGSGSLDWVQKDGVSTVDFHGPLGAGAVHMQGEASASPVQTPRGDDFVTTDPKDDRGERLPQPMPVLSLRYWVLGIP